MNESEGDGLGFLGRLCGRADCARVNKNKVVMCVRLSCAIIKKNYLFIVNK